MKKVIKNNYKFILGIIIGLIISITTVYAVEAYIESNKVSFDNKHTKTNNVQDAIDELYERSGIHKEKWIDKELNGADPVLEDPLIPVEIKPNGDVYYANLNSEWYNYSEKRWANAVILAEEPSNKNYKAGDKIAENDIISYFVWIPRYQYKIWNMGDYTVAIQSNTLTDKDFDTSPNHLLGSARIIDIKFGSVENAPKMNESEAAIDKYYTHPAFTLGEKDLNGIWVGKFETGYNQSGNKKGPIKELEKWTHAGSSLENTDSTKIIVKPDVYSWRNMSVKSMFEVSYNYDRNLDSHMLKNTEWGAAAILSHSAYGIGGEVNINNYSQYKTGYSSYNSDQSTFGGTCGTSKDVTQPWNTPVGYLASTTGNISGIYDMSGGVHEYVAGYRESSLGQSGFDNEDDLKGKYKDYVNIYNSNSDWETYNNRILGDATGEMGPFYRYNDKNDGARPHTTWYGDSCNFVNKNAPWFTRGGLNNNGLISGQFNFRVDPGNAFVTSGFRIALAVQ